MTNTLFPEAARELGLSAPVFGGWMYALAEDLRATHGLELAIASPYSGREPKTLRVQETTHYLFPRVGIGNIDLRITAFWRAVVQDYSPHLIHIHGTEFSHGLSLLRQSADIPSLVSLQGVVSAIGDEYLAGLTRWEILRSITIRDLLRADSIFQARRRFLKAGQLEKESLRRCGGIIGRTEWDKAQTYQISPETPYYHCNESLRSDFYGDGDLWSMQTCTPHRIFVSQAAYPLKGLHQLLRAAWMIRGSFPKMEIHIAGPDFVRSSSLGSNIRRGGYAAHIRRLIRELDLSDCVHFLGNLPAAQMRSQYAAAHVFICPSSLENSPNSVGEAQIIGVPVVASARGGLPTMVEHEATGLLYDFNDVPALAERMTRIFSDSDLSQKLSQAGRTAALRRHDRQANTRRMLEIYERSIRSAHQSDECVSDHSLARARALTSVV